MSIFPTRILLATDGSAEADLATQAAVELSNKTDSELHVIHAARFTMSIPEGWSTAPLSREGAVQPPYEKSEQEAQALLDKQVRKIEAAGGTVAGVYPRVGQPHEEIVILSEEIGIGLIVMGSRGLGGVRRAVMGSVSDSVVRHAHCPVLIMRG